MQVLFLGSWSSGEWVKAFCWTLAHSLWQGFIAAAIAGMIILFTKKSTARLRYHLLSLLLIFFLLVCVSTLIMQFNHPVATGSQANQVLVNENPSEVLQLNSTQTVNSVPILTRFNGWLDANSGLLFTWWSIFFAFNCLKLMTGLASVQRLRHHRVMDPGQYWNARIQELSQKIGIQEQIRFLQSEIIKVPVTIGFLKPVILVPIGLLAQLPPEQVEAILLHELAHIRRSDYLANLVQRFAEAVFFFNPAVWWISSRIRQEREACCDDLVMANTSQQSSYLHALVAFQEMQLQTTGFAMSIGTKRNYLLDRVKRLLTRENKKLNKMEKSILLSGVALLMAFNFMPNEFSSPAPSGELKNISVKTKTDHHPAILIEKTVTSPEGMATAKKSVKPVIKTLADQQDTTKKKKAVNYKELNFPSVSTESNNDGKTSTEKITLTDQDGKKYMINRKNEKVMKLVIDGKEIPESEYKDYEGLIKRIDGMRHDTHEMNKRAQEERKKALHQKQLHRDENQQKQRQLAEKIQLQERNIARSKSEEIRRINDKYRQDNQRYEQAQAEMRLKKAEEINRVRQKYQGDQDKLREKRQEYLREQLEENKKQELRVRQQNNISRIENKYEIKDSKSVKTVVLNPGHPLDANMSLKTAPLYTKSVSLSRSTTPSKNNQPMLLKERDLLKLKPSTKATKSIPVKPSTGLNRQVI